MKAMTAKVARLKTRLAAEAHRLASESSATTAVECDVLIAFVALLVAARQGNFGDLLAGVLETLAKAFR